MPERRFATNAISFNELGLEHKSMEIGKVPFFVKMTEKDLVARSSEAHETALPKVEVALPNSSQIFIFDTAELEY
jgi:hypothetical protein